MTDINSIYDLQINADTFTTIMSQRKSGKSVLISNMIHHFMTNPDEAQRCHFVYVFSQTAAINEKTNHSYKFLDKRTILQPDPNLIAGFWARLKQSQIDTNMKYRILLVFDDIVVTKRYEILDTIASLGRHFGITCILSSQISNNCVSPTIRNNSDYVFWRKLGKEALRDHIYPFMSISTFDDYRGLHQYTKDNTSDYTFLFYDRSKDVSDIKLVQAVDLPEDYKYQLADPKPQKRKKRSMIDWWNFILIEVYRS